MTETPRPPVMATVPAARVGACLRCATPASVVGHVEAWRDDGHRPMVVYDVEDRAVMATAR